MPLKLLKNCNLVDLKQESIYSCNILVSNERILKIIFNGAKTRNLINYPYNNLSNLQIIDLKSNYIIPGFTDSHTHLLSHGIELQRIDLSDCHSPEECLEKIDADRGKEFIFGVNWDESNWIKGKKEDLTRLTLDKISKIKPVIMRRVCGHFAVCNSKALQFIPKELKIVNRKNGWLYEDAALYLNKIFKPSFEMYKKGLEMAMKEALSMGITSIHEITDISGFKIYQSLKGKLKLRVALYLTGGLQPITNSNMQSNFGDEFLKFSGLKLFMDGSIGALTAGIKKPYQNSKNKGKILIPNEKLLNLIEIAECHSIQLMIHSIGDRSTDLVLKAFEMAGIGKNPLRHRLEHIEMLDKRQIKKIVRMNLIASMQPNFLRWQMSDNMYEKNLGLRYKEMNCFKRVKDAGIRLIFGSDCMPLGPIYGIGLAVNHPSVENRLSPAEAISLYTETPPYATFDEDKKGKIEENKLADFVVLDKNPLMKENLKNLKVIGVFVAGVPIYNI